MYHSPSSTNTVTPSCMRYQRMSSKVAGGFGFVQWYGDVLAAVPRTVLTMQ